MFDDFQKIIDAIHKMSDAERATAQTAFVCWCVARVVYYIVVAFVAWALGRRIVQACFAALREARRMP